MKLTTFEKNFLAHEGIPLSEVYDARGEPIGWHKNEMKRIGKRVACNTTPHSPCGYSLKTRHGHCIICNRQALSHIARYNQLGIVYVAYSKTRNLIKIGCTENLIEREASLRNQSYGGCNDWKIEHDRFTKEMSRIENEVHIKLHQYAVTALYEKDGDFQEANELYICSIEQAKKALDSLLDC